MHFFFFCEGKLEPNVTVGRLVADKTDIDISPKDRAVDEIPPEIPKIKRYLNSSTSEEEEALSAKTGFFGQIMETFSAKAFNRGQENVLNSLVKDKVDDSFVDRKFRVAEMPAVIFDENKSCLFCAVVASAELLHPSDCLGIICTVTSKGHFIPICVH